MDLLVFDLDRTLLNGDSQITEYTADTLRRLQLKGIAYTVATGRTFHAAKGVLEGSQFNLPQVYKNGVLTWDPKQRYYSRKFLMSFQSVQPVVDLFVDQSVVPYIFTVTQEGEHAVYHYDENGLADERIAAKMGQEDDLPAMPMAALDQAAGITNVCAVGECGAIKKIYDAANGLNGLVAYSGAAIEDKNLSWVDIHSDRGSKGAAVSYLKQQLNDCRLICFGDSDNDASMFAVADECYAPENGRPAIKALATEVIGHHNEDGVARFLRDRFKL